jgi:RNA polymerase sigma-70 factor (ECF subfamily)
VEKEHIITSEENSSEEEILIRSQTDSEAFKSIYTKYFKKIFLFVLHRVGEKQVSADITQQVFLKALMGLSKFQFKGLPFSAWLYRIAINECNDFFRKTKKSRLVVLEETKVEHLFEELTSDNTQEELARKLPLILQRLNVDELQVIEFRFFEGKPFKEIAEILGITETYAKVKTYRTLEKMKKLFLSKK